MYDSVVAVVVLFPKNDKNILNQIIFAYIKPFYFFLALKKKLNNETTEPVYMRCPSLAKVERNLCAARLTSSSVFTGRDDLVFQSLLFLVISAEECRNFGGYFGREIIHLLRDTSHLNFPKFLLTP